MNKRRLLKLADLLEADAGNRRGVRFNLGTVIERGKLPSKDSATVPMTCGTQACAMGLAALSGEFKRQGLSYDIDRSYGELYIHTTMYGIVSDYDDAASVLFDIAGEEANFLFSPHRYPENMNLLGAKAERFVAKRIRDFVAGKVAP